MIVAWYITIESVTAKINKPINTCQVSTMNQSTPARSVQWTNHILPGQYKKPINTCQISTMNQSHPARSVQKNNQHLPDPYRRPISTWQVTTTNQSHPTISINAKHKRSTDSDLHVLFIADLIFFFILSCAVSLPLPDADYNREKWRLNQWQQWNIPNRPRGEKMSSQTANS